MVSSLYIMQYYKHLYVDFVSAVLFFNCILIATKKHLFIFFLLRSQILFFSNILYLLILIKKSFNMIISAVIGRN